MARSIAEIQSGIVTSVQSDTVLGPLLTSTSGTAIWYLWTYIVAACQWTLENLFDTHKNEVAGIIATQKPHSLQWYVSMAKAFQYGIALPPDSDVYAIVPPVDPTVLIISNAAAVELVNLLRIKVAKLVSGSLSPLSSGELTAFTAYMAKIKDAGVRLQCTSGNADNLQLALNIFYDPLILNADGSRVDGTETTPILDAMNAFLDNPPFNGVFMLNSMIAALQAIPGVIIGQPVTVQANYGATPYLPITTQYVPDAGYMKLDATYFNANITYAPYTL